MSNIIKIGGKLFNFKERSYTMGILNLTPDSFSDGGTYIDVEKAVKRALEMVDEGVDIIDLGGESTRPGATPITLEEELRRVLPVVEELVKRVDIPISIDTYKSKVAEEALKLGAHIINDIKGLKGDPDMGRVVKKYDAFLVMMHIQGTPETMQEDPRYDNLVLDIKKELEESIEIAHKAGIPDEKIILDPGLGFGKTFENNLEIINSIGEFKKLGYPILIGGSRKGFIGRILDLPPLERLEGNLAIATISGYLGAGILRVHDIKETVKVLKVVNRLRDEK